VMGSRDQGGSELGDSSREERIVTSTTFHLGIYSAIHAMQYAYRMTVATQHLDLQQLSKTSSTRMSNAQSTATEPFDP